MEKAKGVGKLHPLPFTTFGEITALRLKARVCCSRCYEHRSIDPAAEHLRDRCFATTRFRCTKIRYTGNVCGCAGSVEIEPSVLLPVGGKDTLAFLSCSTCVPSWEINHVPIDKPPWSVVNREGNDRFRCPGVRESRDLAYPWSDLAADLRRRWLTPAMGNGPHYLPRGLIFPLITRCLMADPSCQRAYADRA